MKGNYDEVNGVVIGDIDTSKRIELRNTANGTLVADSRVDTDADAHVWAKAVIESLAHLWGTDFTRKYPKGFDLRIYDH